MTQKKISKKLRKEAVSIETFNTRKGKKQYIVARNPDGTIDQRRPVAGTRKEGMYLRDFKTLYKNQWSLYEERVRDPRTNVTQVSITQKVKATTSRRKSQEEIAAMSKKEKREYQQSQLPVHKRKPLPKRGQRGKAQYVVEAHYQGKRYVATSKFKGATAPDGYVFPDSATSRACKESAWKNLFQQISVRAGRYDADEGLRMIEDNGITRVKEGWMFYSKGSPKFHYAKNR